MSMKAGEDQLRRHRLFLEEYPVKVWIAFSMAVWSFGASGMEWQCRNTDMEVSCLDAKCTSNIPFTPLDIAVSKTQIMTLCAYSGCWEGRAKIVKSQHFMTIVANNLAPQGGNSGQESRGSSLIIDLTDKIGIMKFENFAQPMACESR
jgi:hypothetical protein